MTVPVSLRPAAPGDLKAIMPIEAASFHRPWNRETFTGLLGRRDADVLVATLEGTVVGYAVLIARAGDTELANLAVDPAHRRRGIGSALLRGCREIFGDRGGQWIFLAVRATNEAAAALYDSSGFREVGRHPVYYDDPPEDAVIFALEVGRAPH